MTDIFTNRADSPLAPAVRCAMLTPADGTQLNEIPKALYIGTGGDLVIEPAAGGGAVTFANLADGSVLPVRVRAVHATGTSAADIVALY